VGKDLPMIVLDGQNVCLQHDDNAQDKLKGLRQAVTYFLDQGWRKEHLMVVFPRAGWPRRMKKLHPPLEATFIYTPSGVSKEDDDIFALQIARRENALLLTNDLFRNHFRRWTNKFGKEEGDALRTWCSTHLLPFTFARDRLVPHIEVLKNYLATSSPMRVVRCFKCRTQLAKEEDIIASSDPARTYDGDEEVNPAGFVFCFSKFSNVINTQEHWHQLCPILEARGPQVVAVRQLSPPRMQDSWYPDYYSWCLLFCSCCESSLGWHFRLERSLLAPRQPLFDLLVPEFFGLRHDAISLVDTDTETNCAAPPGFSKSL